ncbi:MAG TPA: type II toxin-antitoxin system VapC family toxin [Candidatus Acidoferrum sp.]|nr:type II toxin-antitoxin system VapC family toxin [Candidatus Acidoferrum sp.]
MKKTTAFWDSSALVPLCIRQAGSRQAQFYLRKFDLVIWWGTYVEVHSAICRLRRERLISDDNKQGAVARLRLLSRGWREVLPDDQVRELATESLDKYSLRAADALQLAASLIWCCKQPSRRNFICADRRLAQAADAAGFSVLEIPTANP